MKDISKLKHVDGVDARVLRLVGFTAQQMLAAGYSVQSLKRADFKGVDLLQAGIPLSALKQAGYLPSQLFLSGKTSGKDLVAAGFPAQELILAGLPLQELKSVNITAETLLAARVIREGRAVSFSPQELKAAGFTAAELSGAKVPLAELIKLGYAIADLAFFPVAELKAADFSIEQFMTVPSLALPAHLLAAGFELSKLKACGVSVADIRKAPGVLLKPGEYKSAGYAADQMKIAGFTLLDLRKAGFSITDLVSLGYSHSELRVSGFGSAVLASVGIQNHGVWALSTPAEYCKCESPASCNLTHISKADLVSLPSPNGSIITARMVPGTQNPIGFGLFQSAENVEFASQWAYDHRFSESSRVGMVAMHDGMRYHGQLLNGIPHGWGYRTRNSPTESWICFFDRGCPNGPGISTTPSAGSTTGRWKIGVANPVAEAIPCVFTVGLQSKAMRDAMMEFVLQPTLQSIIHECFSNLIHQLVDRIVAAQQRSPRLVAIEMTRLEQEFSLSKCALLMETLAEDRMMLLGIVATWFRLIQRLVSSICASSEGGELVTPLSVASTASNVWSTIPALLTLYLLLHRLATYVIPSHTLLFATAVDVAFSLKTPSVGLVQQLGSFYDNILDVASSFNTASSMPLATHASVSTSFRSLIASEGQLEVLETGFSSSPDEFQSLASLSAGGPAAGAVGRFNIDVSSDVVPQNTVSYIMYLSQSKSLHVLSSMLVFNSNIPTSVQIGPLQRLMVSAASYGCRQLGCSTTKDILEIVRNLVVASAEGVTLTLAGSSFNTQFGDPCPGTRT